MKYFQRGMKEVYFRKNKIFQYCIACINICSFSIFLSWAGCSNILRSVTYFFWDVGGVISNIIPELRLELVINCYKAISCHGNNSYFFYCLTAKKKKKVDFFCWTQKMSSFSFLLPFPINIGFSDFAGFFITGFVSFKTSLVAQSDSSGGQRPQVSVSKIRGPLSLQREVFEGPVGSSWGTSPYWRPTCSHPPEKEPLYWEKQQGPARWGCKCIREGRGDCSADVF